eukprot:16275-Rhodomonas_salina.1
MGWSVRDQARGRGSRAANERPRPSIQSTQRLLQRVELARGTQGTAETERAEAGHEPSPQDDAPLPLVLDGSYADRGEIEAKGGAGVADVWILARQGHVGVLDGLSRPSAQQQTKGGKGDAGRAAEVVQEVGLEAERGGGGGR